MNRNIIDDECVEYLDVQELSTKESIEETTTGTIEVEPQTVALLKQKLQQAVKELEKNKELLALANKEIDEKNKKTE